MAEDASAFAPADAEQSSPWPVAETSTRERITTRHAMRDHMDTRGRLPQEDNGNLQFSGSKRRRAEEDSRSDTVVPSTAADRERERTHDKHDDILEDKDGTSKRPRRDMDAVTAQRGKRMFGALLGHLSKAKSTLESEPVKRVITAQHQQQIAAAEHDAERRKREAAEAIAAKQAAKEAHGTERRMQRAEREKEDIIAIIARCDTYLDEALKPVGSFILTSTQPPIYWRPGEWSKGLQELCIKTSDGIRAQIAERKSSLVRWRNEHTGLASAGRIIAGSTVRETKEVPAPELSAHSTAVENSVLVKADTTPDDKKPTADTERVSLATHLLSSVDGKALIDPIPADGVKEGTQPTDESTFSGYDGEVLLDYGHD